MDSDISIFTIDASFVRELQPVLSDFLLDVTNPTQDEGSETLAGARADNDPCNEPCESESGSHVTAHSAQAGGPLTCLTCGVGLATAPFKTVAEQRAHFRSDWHRMNVKRKLRGQPGLTAEDCERSLAEQEDGASSLSGSDSESDEEESERPGPSGQLMAHQEPRAILRRGEGQDAKFYAVWNCLLFQDHLKKADAVHADQLRSLLMRVSQKHRQWAVIMNRGGHFAAGVFDMGARGRPDQPQATARIHKTFHRYVVRQGQGGRQSAQDKTGKFAKSAGSSMRRYNEAALERDIADTLLAWKDELAGCDLIFVHAPSANAKAVLGEGPGKLDSNDPRIRRIPFTMRRPTFKEIQRCLSLLIALPEVPDPASTASSQPVAAKDKQTLASAQKARELASRQQPADKPPTTTHHKPPAEDLQTPLHKAAKAGSSQRVKDLLEAGADPCAQDAGGRTPFELADDRETRNVFRRFMAEFPEQWDYQAARVPSALTPEMESSQEAKKAEKKARQRERERARKAAEAEKRAEKSAGVSREDAAEDEVARAALEAAALADKMYGKQARKKGEPQVSKPQAAAAPDPARKRELMAAAAEARLKALQAASQSQQLWQ